MNWLESIINKPEKLIIGLMSGTSMDGVDAALVNLSGSGIETNVSLVDFICIPYARSISEKLRLIYTDCTVKLLSDLNFEIGRAFADAAVEILRKNSLSKGGVDLIGTHGQTVYHNPPSGGETISSTLQIGEPDVIADITGITTVGDFRTRDVASGGEGAPLIPLIDYILFHDRDGVRVAQNIGGIANLTVITKNLDDVFAFDTGPGNSLIDSVMGLHTDWERNLDESGKIASSGNVDNSLLSQLLNNEYFTKQPPKSTGKELFGEELAENIYKKYKQRGISFEDLVSTLTQFTVDSIFNSCTDYVFNKFDVKEIILSGGGARNDEIVRRLKDKMPEKMITTSDDYGVPAEAKEAIGFAILANETISGHPGNLPHVTGVKKASPIGKISISNRSI